jgi:transposase-like protein
MAKERKPHRKVATAKSSTVAKLPSACSDETLAVEFMEEQRWGNNPTCALCGSADVYQMRDRKTGERNNRFLWRCHACRRQYTVRIGTVLEDSRIPLMHWCYAFWRACCSKKGVAALEIQRQTGLSYKSALFLLHRVRYAMTDGLESQPKLKGTVEVDETYVGGKPRYSQRGKRGRHLNDNKMAVVAMVERGGNVRALTAAKISGINVRQAVREMIDPTSRLMTDESPLYKGVGKAIRGRSFRGASQRPRIRPRGRHSHQHG